jgi:collagenase-like PrtC family protease
MGLDGGINPNCGFHCKQCRKSWLPHWSGLRVKLMEVQGHHLLNEREDAPGIVPMGRMKLDELLKLLNPNEQ